MIRSPWSWEYPKCSTASSAHRPIPKPSRMRSPICATDGSRIWPLLRSRCVLPVPMISCHLCCMLQEHLSTLLGMAVALHENFPVGEASWTRSYANHLMTLLDSFETGGCVVGQV